MLHFSS